MTAKIGDFGVAQMLPELYNISCMTRVPGTFAFMPPEVFINNPIYDTSIDVFSFDDPYTQWSMAKTSD